MRMPWQRQVDAAAKVQVPMSETTECPNGMCSRRPTEAAAKTYGKPAAGQIESAVFALG